MGVVMATGGYSANAKMIQANNTSGKWGDLSSLPTTNRHASSQGDGITADGTRSARQSSSRPARSITSSSPRTARNTLTSTARIGGLKIDESARVLSDAGIPIERLYACGEVVGGIHGGNRLGGNAVTDTVVFGRIAGRSVVSDHK